MSWLLRKIGGVFPYQPEDVFDHDKKVFHRHLSEPTQRLLKRIYEGIDPSRVVDYHTHIVGTQQEQTGCKLDPEMFDFWRHPLKYMKTQIFMYGCGLSSLENSDKQYVDRLLRLIKHSAPGQEKSGKPIHGRNCILAFDQVYTNQCEPDERHTTMYIPNDYVYQLAEDHPNEFVATCSVHPFRANALEELERCRKRGIKLIKWLVSLCGVHMHLLVETYVTHPTNCFGIA
jgi:mannonate dehydratase